MRALIAGAVFAVALLLPTVTRAEPVCASSTAFDALVKEQQIVRLAVMTHRKNSAGVLVIEIWGDRDGRRFVMFYRDGDSICPLIEDGENFRVVFVPGRDS